MYVILVVEIIQIHVYIQIYLNPIFMKISNQYIEY